MSLFSHLGFLTNSFEQKAVFSFLHFFVSGLNETVTNLVAGQKFTEHKLLTLNGGRDGQAV
jgi:hypothetical protein